MLQLYVFYYSYIMSYSGVKDCVFKPMVFFENFAP